MRKKLCNIFKLKRLKILFLAQSLFYNVFLKFICGQGKRRVNGRIHQLLDGSILGFSISRERGQIFPLTNNAGVRITPPRLINKNKVYPAF